MRRLVLGTAGHIDHGKTALVRALTGTDTDRLPEEKRRGITIDLGFARLVVGDECELGIVDVPGHEAFVRNMVAGATGIDLVLLVVAADEGVMPQTREHLAIIELLGIRRGVVAITKSDLADPEWLELVRDDVAQLLAPGPLADAPMVTVSARTRDGLDVLVHTLAAVAASVPARCDDDLFRMPIDRVFTARGTGTVVTGTVWSGALHRDEHVRIEPAGLGVRVRALQHHGAEADCIGPGERAAIALAGLDRQRLRRGDTVVTGAGWTPAGIVTTRLTMLRDASAPLRARQRVRVHVGTAEVLGRVALFADELAPGASALAQLRLESPILARTGDHIVIRSYSPVHTIAGGVILEPVAPKRKRLTASTRHALDSVLEPPNAPAAAQALAGASLPLAVLPVRTGLAPRAATDAVAADSRLIVVGDRIVDASHVQQCHDAIMAHVAAFHLAHPLDDGIERETLRRAMTDGGGEIFDITLQRALQDGVIQARGAAIARTDFRAAPTASQQSMLAKLTTIFAAAGLQSPSTDELPGDVAADPQLSVLLRHLEREGVLVRISAGRWTHAAALAQAVSAVRTQLPAGQEVEVAEFRNILGLSRKHLIPLLEFLDRTGVTLRRGDARVLIDAASTPPAPAVRPPAYVTEP